MGARIWPMASELRFVAGGEATVVAVANLTAGDDAVAAAGALALVVVGVAAGWAEATLAMVCAYGKSGL